MPLDTVRRRHGHDRPPEAEARRLGQASRHRARPGAARRRGRSRRTRRGRCGSGRSSSAEATAMHTARSAPGSLEADTADGRGVHIVAATEGRPAARARRAGGTAGPDRTPVPSGAAGGSDDFTVSACISTSSGRCPSSVGTTTEPAAPGRRSDRNRPLGSGTPTQALLGHLEQSELAGRTEAVLHRPQQAQARGAVRPRTTAPCRRCARATRGPASAPSFVTWPTSTMAIPRRFASCTRRCAHSRTWTTEPAVDGRSGSATVWILSITTTSGSHLVDRRQRRAASPSRPATTGRANRPRVARPAT